MHYLARREFGKVARVYPIDDDLLVFRPRAWVFSPTTKLCRVGVAATGRTAQLALMALHSVEEDAARELMDRAQRRYVDAVREKL